MPFLARNHSEKQFENPDDTTRRFSSMSSNSYHGTGKHLSRLAQYLRSSAARASHSHSHSGGNDRSSNLQTSVSSSATTASSLSRSHHNLRHSSPPVVPDQSKSGQKLFDLIMKKDWKMAEEHALKSPEDVRVWTVVGGEEDGKTTISSPGKNVAKVGCCGGDDTESTTTATTSATGETNVNQAADDEAKPKRLSKGSSLRKLLAKNSSSSRLLGVNRNEKNRMKPLHLACQRGAPVSLVAVLVKANKEAAEETDSMGLLPIHWACKEGASCCVITTLLRANPSGADVVVENNRGGGLTGKTPLDIATESKHCNRDDVIKELNRGADYWSMTMTRTSVKTNSVRSEEIPLLYSFLDRREWDQALQRLQSHPHEASIWVEESTTTTCLPIHIACHRRAPSHVLASLISKYPSGLEERGGKHYLLPIHVACQSGCRTDSVQTLLRAHPEGVMEKDDFGLLPLHLAIAEDAEPGVVEALIKTNPSSVGVKDRRGNDSVGYAMASMSPHRREYIKLLC